MVAAGVWVAWVHRLPAEERTRAATKGQFDLAVVGVALTLVGFLVAEFNRSSDKGDDIAVTVPSRPSVTGSGMTATTQGTPTATSTPPWTVTDSVPVVPDLEPGGGRTSQTATRTTVPPSPTKPPAASTVLFSDMFGSSGSGWSVGAEAHGEKGYVSGGYQIQVRDPGYALWSVAPRDPAASAIRVSATARLMGGQGGWGVWCRGTSSGARYEFTLTHSGTVYIKAPSGGSPLYSVPGLNAFQNTTLGAECSDAPGGAGVELTMRVNTAVVANQELARLGHVQVRAVDEIFVRIPTPQEVRRLDLSPGTPVAVHVITGYGVADQPLRCVVSLLPGDRHVIVYDRPGLPADDAVTG